MDTQNNLPQNALLINQPAITPIQPNQVQNMIRANILNDMQATQFINYINPSCVTIQPNNITSYINGQPSIVNNIKTDNINNDNNESETEEKKDSKHLKRRSKCEQDGRTFECKLCSKSYLSYPALYTHYKQKHNTNNSSGRGRGRPKKGQGELEVEKLKFNPTNASFFSKEDRTGQTEPTKEINECIMKAFQNLYENKEEIIKRNELRGMKQLKSVEEHKFLSKYLKDPHDTNKSNLSENEITDNVLINYLNKMSKFCNKEYFTHLIIFVTLFREHINKINSTKSPKENNEEYTECNKAEDVPDSSNEFITDFLDPDGKSADFGFSRDEAIDLTQNLCYWMYENNFTCSKLSLIHNEQQ